MRQFILLLLCSCLVPLSFGSNLTVSQPMLYVEGEQAYAVLNVKWANAWNNQKNKDVIWLFFKAVLPEVGYRHIAVAEQGHEIVCNFSKPGSEYVIEVDEERLGIFLATDGPFRGDVEVTLKISLDVKSMDGLNLHNLPLKAFGIEMVEIPEGGFFLGDASPGAIEEGALYQPNNKGEFASLVHIQSQAQELTVEKGGDLYYQNPRGYCGDQSGKIPASYPNGFAAFYLMKYEITAGEYASFLNTLSPAQLEARIPTEASGYYEGGGCLKANENRFIAEYPDKPCQFLSWDDAMAYADWACLRPMTEFEFAKACRGSRKGMSEDYPWGQKPKEQVQRLPTSDKELAMVNGWPESKLSDSTLAYYGASYYWVMDLSGSLWERLVSIGHPAGRAFDGTNGDGELSPEGYANTRKWPVGKEDAGGVGFRGGGFYGYDRGYHKYNPFSPVAYRPYGGWHGTMRSVAYGTRLAR